MPEERLRWELAAARAQLKVVGKATGPAHVYIAVGLRPDALAALTRTLSQRRTVTADHIPVVLTDSPAFRHAKTAGVVLEYLPDARTWRRHRPSVPWDDLLTSRLTRIFVDFGCARTVVVDPDRLPTLAELLG